MLKYLQVCLLTAFLGATSLQAQDHIDYIYLLNGEAIEAEVESIQGQYVRYTPYEQGDSPDLRIAKTEIDRVKMANGTEIWYNRLPKMAEPVVETAAPETGKKRKKKKPISAKKLSRQR